MVIVFLHIYSSELTWHTHSYRLQATEKSLPAGHHRSLWSLIRFADKDEFKHCLWWGYICTTSQGKPIKQVTPREHSRRPLDNFKGTYPGGSLKVFLFFCLTTREPFRAHYMMVLWRLLFFAGVPSLFLQCNLQRSTREHYLKVLKRFTCETFTEPLICLFLRNHQKTFTECSLNTLVPWVRLGFGDLKTLSSSCWRLLQKRVHVDSNRVD